MIQWECIAPYLFGDLEALIEQINALGKDGWELVQLNPSCSNGGSRVVLKRPLQPPLIMFVPEGHDHRPGAVNYVR